MFDFIDFGTYAAEMDLITDNPELFVTTAKGRAIRTKCHKIIFGRKGSGKTALEMDFRRQYSDDYGYVLYIDANDIGICKIIDLYKELEHYDMGAAELFRSYTNLWEYCILINIMSGIFDENDTNTDCLRICNFLRENQSKDKHIFSNILDNTDYLKKIFSEQYRYSPSEIKNIVEGYPLNESTFKDAIKDCSNYLKKDDFKVLVTFDKVDTYWDITEELRMESMTLSREQLNKLKIFEQRAL